MTLQARSWDTYLARWSVSIVIATAARKTNVEYFIRTFGLLALPGGKILTGKAHTPDVQPKRPLVEGAFLSRLVERH